MIELNMTPKEKADELYSVFEIIIYNNQDAKQQILDCMEYYIQSMINEHYFDKKDIMLIYWGSVKIEKDKL
jgi:hypothetical protein